MKKLILSLICLCLLPGYAFAELNVVATLPTLGAVAKAVCGKLANVTVLATINEDPHFVDARPDFILKLNKADVLLYNGMEYEIGWLPTLQTSSRNTAVDTSAKTAIDASIFVKKLEVPTAKVERSGGDIHPAGNPHYLYSAPNVVAIAKGFAKRMADIDPENALTYEENAKKFTSHIDSLIAEIDKKFAELPESARQVISYHQSFIYLADWLKIKVVATVEPKPGVSPNPSHVAKVLGLMKEDKVKVILQETYQPTSTSKKLAGLAGAKLVRISTGPTSKQTYAQYLTIVMDEIYKAMK